MRMEGNYHIVLREGVSEADFIEHVKKEFSDSRFSTRVTSAIDNRLLKVEGGAVPPHYVFQLSVELVTDVPYDFAEHVAYFSEFFEAYGVVTAVDIRTLIE
jgi:hypothetical protein